MYLLQFLNYRGFRCSVFPCSNENFQKSGAAIPSSFCGRGINFKNGVSKFTARRSCGRVSTVFAAVSSSSSSSFNMNLNEYMVTLEKPLGIRFGLSVEGKIFVLALQKGLFKLENLELNGRLMKLGNAEKSRIVMVGDTLKKASESSTSKLVEIKDYGDMEILVKEKAGSCSLVLERPSSPFPIHLYLLNDLDTLFNESLVPVSTWNDHIQSPNSNASGEGAGKSGSVTFCPKLLSSKGWKYLNDQNKNGQPKIAMNSPTLPFGPLVATFTEELPETTEWGHGSFPLEEYVKALEHSNEELYYNHSLGMRYSKITEQIYVGSCIQTEKDVETLSDTVESQNDIVRSYWSRHLGVTAVLNFQSTIEAANWGIDSNSINESCQKFNILMINHPIRDSDSFDMRKKLPFCVGLLLRLLKKNHRVCITCTTGFDRSPACVIAYLHWITDTSLHAAHNFVTGLHTCRPDRPAIAWATWDLIAMVESGIHDGPSTHAVTFVWNGHEGEDVSLVGDFTGNWKEPIKAVHKGGPKYEVDIRLPQGKYYYKYIINENWRHSTASPTERDERGNVNNVIVIGDTASVEPSLLPPQKDANIVKVIERPLTENERFMLAKAARCVAFSVCPIRLAPK